MPNYTLLFIMMTGNMLLAIASQHEKEKKGEKRTLIDTFWLLLVFMAWVITIVGMMIWN